MGALFLSCVDGGYCLEGVEGVENFSEDLGELVAY